MLLHAPLSYWRGAILLKPFHQGLYLIRVVLRLACLHVDVLILLYYPAVEHFRETIPSVKNEIGYLATNAHLSLDGRHFFNYGQYDTVDHFRAIFSKQDVIQAFATFPMQGFVPELHTYEVVLVDC
ncbi:hypothetical protein NIES4071_93170 [Calothrix sp. NIES-4071]|nr:hypothetical protein NIES4071_93170 [Calothrix sp. NIES-4071]BAZ63583.1 hypothetical protein NIES4105_93100 [Calothrix sp. NIES-4105]